MGNRQRLWSPFWKRGEISKFEITSPVSIALPLPTRQRFGLNIAFRPPHSQKHMKIAIFSRESNPAIDQACFYASKDRLNMLLATGSVRMLTSRTAQYLCEQRDPLKRAAIAKKAYIDGGDNCRTWRVVNQSKPGFGPGEPVYQMVP